MSAASNFDFLRGGWPALHAAAARAEAAAKTDPRAACFHARFVLEHAVRWLYDHDAALPYGAGGDSLGSLLHEPALRRLLDGPVFRKAEAVHRVGNLAVHDARPVGPGTALQAVRELHHVLYWLARHYGQGKVRASAFDEGLVPSGEAAREDRQRVEAELARLAAQVEQQARETELGQAALAAEQARVAAIVAEKEAAEARALAAQEDTEAALALAEEMEGTLRAAQEAREATRDTVERLRLQTSSEREAVARTPDPHDYSEAETRQFRVDLALQGAGWDHDAEGVAEYRVGKVDGDGRSVPGSWFVDYVLWGDDGLPLAVVEAKKASVSAEKGRIQARRYADALEARFGQRPVIFYTNGYETWLWDDAQTTASGGVLPAREVMAPYSKEGLLWLLHQRTHRQPLAGATPDPQVAGRDYQVKAVAKTFERFGDGHRRALLAMATGTGKTRTAVAMAQLLVNLGWTKRVLFLADRRELVKQATKAFKRHAPDLPVVNLLEETDNGEARVVVSTYPTMVNAVERSATDGGPDYGVDAFGLVIVDEAHRSIYDRYRVLFDYFDALFLGLTATPRDEVSHDTYGLFELPPGEPTFAYGLDEAVEAGHLVPPRAVEAELGFVAGGITYDDLSDEEKASYEDAFTDVVTGEIPAHVDAAALNQWLFNEDTVDKAIRLLLDKGIKVAGGDRLAKTIVFARNQEHARFLAQRFAKVAPQLGGDFAEAIYHGKPRVDDVIEGFLAPGKAPHVAVSVDMLDTGFDAPDVANLLVFKPVRSRVKWDQMLGRGTRPRVDLFGPGRDKRCFYVFDLCGNFDFFRNKPDGVKASRSRGLGERLFRARMGLALASAQPSVTLDDGDRQRVRSRALDALHAHVVGLPEGTLALRTGEAAQLRKRFGRREAWEGLTERQAQRLLDHLGTVPDGRDDGELARQVDLLAVEAQRALVLGEAVPEKTRSAFAVLAEALRTKTTVPAVAAAEPTLDGLRDGRVWAGARPATVEGVRETLAPLAYLASSESEAGRRVYTQFLDALRIVSEPGDDGDVVPGTGAPEEVAGAVTRREVEVALTAQLDHPAVAALYWNEQVTPDDLDALAALVDEAAGSEGAFRAALEADPPTGWEPDEALGVTVRRLVGLAPGAAQKALADVPAEDDRQRAFLDHLVAEIAEAGVVGAGRLFESPYTDRHPSGLVGVFPVQAPAVLAALQAVRANAERPAS